MKEIIQPKDSGEKIQIPAESKEIRISDRVRPEVPNPLNFQP